MNKPDDKNEQLSIVVDRKHGTTYCIEPNGRSYIKKVQIIKGEKR